MTKYRIIELLPPTGGFFTSATCINSAGVVGGNAAFSIASKGVIWADFQTSAGALSEATPSTVISGDSSEIRDINDSGDAVGQSLNSILFRGGVPVDLPIASAGLTANGINNGGLVVGIVNSAGSPQSFVFDSVSLTMVTVSNETLQGINGGGTAVGTHKAPLENGSASIVIGGEIIDLLPPASSGQAINNQGIVAGLVNGVPTLWDTRLAVPAAQSMALPEGLVAVSLSAINNRGDVVGQLVGISGLPKVAGIFTSAGSADLNTLIPENSGWVLFAANDINDLGLIVGDGALNGQDRGFLLMPLGGSVGGTVSGRVTDREGNGLAGASVSFISTLGNSGGDSLPLSTDSSGNYITPVLQPGDYQFTVALDGFVSDSAEVTVNQAATVRNFVLRQDGVLTGHVTSPEGAPLNASLTLNAFQCVTDSAGLYRIALTPGSYSGAVTSPGFKTDNFPVTITDGATLTLDFVLVPEPGILTGHVNSPAGAPLNGVVVTLAGNQAVTDAAGAYQIALPPGLLAGVVSSPGFVSDTFSVTITSLTTVTMDFVLVPAQGGLTGQVTGRDGALLSGVAVVVGEIQAATGADGRYQIELTPGSYSGTVTLHGFVSDSFSVAIPNGTTVSLDFVLSKLGGIAGTVTDDGSVPLTNVKVSVGVTTVRTDAHGKYTLPNLGAGTVNVTVDGGLRFIEQHAIVAVTVNQTTISDFALVSKKPV
ncbi:MAG TPA: carboxypeptidase-like regulatory domain-containing protein [Candidatus Sulfopaludibacter sp.]|jgi:hypothetical protein|nr:carboxypeptidase-like regulatory domain-containing protein [Candidatus Sulfopaludibacter sp.]